jgi:hypothetical protein
MRQFPCSIVCRVCRGGYRVKSAWVKRMAPAEAPHGQPATPASPVHLDRFERVRAARGVKSAMRAEKRADELPVAGDQPSQQPGDCRHFLRAVLFHPAPPCRPALPCRPVLSRRPAPSSRRSSAFTTTSSSAANSACPAVAARGLARNTSRLPLGSLCRYPATRCLRRRRTLFLTTAGPTARLTMNPTLGDSSQSSLVIRCPTTEGRPYLLPLRIAAVKSVLRRMRAALGSIACHRQSDGAALVRR